MSGPAIGIDLGSSTSCVAVFRDDKAEVISNYTGFPVTASYVGFRPDGKVVGDEAKIQQELNPVNTVHGEFQFRVNICNSCNICN